MGKKNKGNLIDVGGRPPKFESPKKLIKAINNFFNDDENKPFTITGLALGLGFASRQSLHDYEKHEEYSYIIKKARTIVENAYEKQLVSGGGAGVIFALKNMNWSDRTKVDMNSKNVTIVMNQDSTDKDI